MRATNYVQSFQSFARFGILCGLVHPLASSLEIVFGAVIIRPVTILMPLNYVCIDLLLLAAMVWCDSWIRPPWSDVFPALVPFTLPESNHEN
jgi:hypothetical protein